MIEVRPVGTRRDLRSFVELPWSIYARSPHWVPPLRLDVKQRLDRKKNPFFEHSDATLFLAWRDGRPVGRIAAIENRRHNEVHGDRVGFFGWFECTDDPATTAALLDRTREWLTDRGLERLRGPASFSLNEECGLLVDAFDLAPVLMMPYNPPYYATLLEGAGLVKAMDLYSFHLPVRSFGEGRMKRIVEKVLRREGAVIRQLRPRHFREDLEILKGIYNTAWTQNWGHVPMTDRELEHMAASLKPVLEPRLCSFVEVDGKAVGFSLVLPNVNEILARLGGRLFPLGLFRLLTGLKKVESVRLLAMGVAPEYRHRGLDAALYYDSFAQTDALGKDWSDLGWVLETNTVMINAIEKMGGRRYKTHRLYEGGVR